MDDDLRLAQRVMLATHGRAHVRIATEAEAALDLIDRAEPWLAGVLIGCRYWSPDGRRVVARLQRDQPWERIPSLLLVDELAPSFLDRVIEEGANGVVARPRDVAEVGTILALLARLRCWRTDFGASVHGGRTAVR